MFRFVPFPTFNAIASVLEFFGHCLAGNLVPMCPTLVVLRNELITVLRKLWLGISFAKHRLLLSVQRIMGLV